MGLDCFSDARSCPEGIGMYPIHGEQPCPCLPIPSLRGSCQTADHSAPGPASCFLLGLVKIVADSSKGLVVISSTDQSPQTDSTPFFPTAQENALRQPRAEGVGCASPSQVQKTQG